MSAADIRVNWPLCEGRCVCHELLPEVIDRDPWGYPVVNGPVPPQLRAAAKDAVRDCPKLALRLVDPPKKPA